MGVLHPNLKNFKTFNPHNKVSIGEKELFGTFTQFYKILPNFLILFLSLFIIYVLNIAQFFKRVINFSVSI